ncbi:hypothetical protein [Serratia entomophila]|uniref:hypothetical protein n=1 Tax=Serratia entomophila TaxID=42906 RepID=UPI0021788571|nr:hypothetical protein [Serratia entomophila]CAI0733134.1 Uncharacterised protein [Serratia entomophila]CAI1694519.1 Uncharacterised protein [Serratia entomophila]CAI2446551.1 Uncharacterised protein [Serratia entomophila]
MESLEKQKQTLTRVRFIAELALIAPRHASDLKLALGMIIDLSSEVLPDEDYDGIFYNADEG